MAIGLIRQGFEVTVLTAMPNYPTGKIYDGYKGWLKIEYLDGIKVLRTAIYPTQSIMIIPRLLSYFSFIFTSCLIGSWKTGKVDCILTESPPLFLGIAGFVLSRWKKAHWIFNISDLWPESAVELGIIDRESLSYRLSSTLEKFLYKKAWIVTCQSRSILENIRNRFANIQVYHLPNGVNTNFFQPNSLQKIDEIIHIVYAGLHGLAQGLEQIIWAAHKLGPSEGFDFTFVGDGPEKNNLISLAKKLNLSQVHFFESVPKEKILPILENADVIVVPLKIQLTGAVPSKLYEAMAMGKPVILIAEGEAAKLVLDTYCGVVVHPGDINGLISAMLNIKAYPEISRLMGLNGRKAAVQNHDRTRVAIQFAQFITNEFERNS